MAASLRSIISGRFMFFMGGFSFSGELGSLYAPVLPIHRHLTPEISRYYAGCTPTTGSAAPISSAPPSSRSSWNSSLWQNEYRTGVFRMETDHMQDTGIENAYDRTLHSQFAAADKYDTLASLGYHIRVTLTPNDFMDPSPARRY